MPREGDPSFQLRTSVEGQRVRLEVEALDQRGLPAAGLDARARITTPSGEQVELPLPQVGPGLYAATSAASIDGTYAVEAVQFANGAPVRSDLGSFVVDRHAETRTLGPNRPLLAQIAAATGGRELSEPSEALARQTAGAVRWQPVWPWLLILAGLLLPLDVALRRFPLFRR
jgi:hypothetical protein